MYDKDIETRKVTIEDGDYVIMSLVLFYLYILGWFVSSLSIGHVYSKFFLEFAAFFNI